jgi:hypothetical protein
MSSNIEKELDFAPYDKDPEEDNLPTEVAVKEEDKDNDEIESDEEEGDEEESDEEGYKEDNELFKAGVITASLCIENAQLKADMKAVCEDNTNVAILKARNNVLEIKIANLERANAIAAAGGSPYTLRSATSTTASPAATVVTTPTFTPPTGAVAIKHQKTLDATMFNIEETIKNIQKEHSGRYTELYMLGVFINQYKEAATHDAAEQKSFSRFIGNKDVDFDTMKATKCTPAPSVAGSPVAGAK